MYTEYEVRQIPLSLKSSKRQAEEFLGQNSLRLDDLDEMYGVYALESDEILACGGHKGNLLKCIAVSEKLRDTGMGTRLISHLINTVLASGYSSVKVFTKPGNREIFSSLGFTLLASAPKAILMESSTKALEKYLDSLPKKEGRNGVIVMNANPFTLGHRYLVQTAAAQVDNLFIIPVKEDRSEYSYAERREMIIAGTGDIGNVTVCQGTDYAISQFTFPTYFLKELSDAADTHMTLDLDLFGRQIAPALGATVRFVGSEPTDALTARYNVLMQEILQRYGVEVKQIERKKEAGHEDRAISASTVRSLIHSWRVREASLLVPASTIPYIIGHAAADSLLTELDTTPKPGLVDRHDSGAHKDMDYDLMRRSIDALRPTFVRLALAGWQAELPATSVIRDLGLQGEKEMYAASGGVNTYKGALFSHGLTAVAAANLFFNEGCAPAGKLQQTIMAAASGFHQTAGTHGAAATANGGVKGALACACEGYPQLFKEWLPYLQEHRGEPWAMHRLLLLIMSEIDDTNIIYRKGRETAERVRQESLELLQNFTPEGLEEMGQRYSQSNISPGGAADMLALTVFICKFVD